MKTFTLVSAMAAGAAATGFLDANPFKCPANIPQKCTPKQTQGYDFGDLEPNKPPVRGYNGFDWKGFTCKDAPEKRDRLGRRTGGRHLGAVCGSDKSQAPSFGVQAGNPDFDDFSLSEIHVDVEFDVDLEFHYGMPDGSKCKHRNSCKKGVKSYKNSQCGGAKDVTIVYPEQPKKPKKTCSIGVHSMSFSCHTKPPFTRPPFTRPTLPPPATYTPTSTSESRPVETTPNTYVPDTSVYSSIVTTSYVSTSTIITYSVSTITTCDVNQGSNGTYCGGNGGVTTTTISYPTTTTYEVTETSYVPGTYTPTPPPSTYQPEEPSTYQPEEPSTYKPEESSTYNPDVPTTTKPSGPKETLPCPSVVPQCLNTFLFLVETCKDNSDHGCYCPSTIFIESIFSCVYAHGETDTIISEAIIFIQGLCAPYVPVNPGVITCATPTSYITPTLTYSVPDATYTTITYTATDVVPCTDDKGIEIPGSSTTTVYPTYVPIPQVGLITGPAGGVGFVPVATPVQAGVVNPTTAARPTATGTATGSRPIVTAGAGRNGAFAAAGLVAAAVAALL